MEQIVAVDVGGTHARFAIASLDGGNVVSLADEAVAKTAEHPSFESAWNWFASTLASPVPRKAAIALAGSVDGPDLKLTNSSWVFRPEDLRTRLGLDRLTFINDFAAIGHAVAQFGAEHFEHLCGPNHPLPGEGVISIVGPGTGLGVAQLVRRGGTTTVIETEGGHADFAPLDGIEDRILQWMRGRHRHVSAERLISGPGLANWYAGLSAIEGRPGAVHDDAALWAAALAGSDAMAVAALDRLCRSLGSFAGDIALAHGANAVVIAGGVGLRLADHLPRSGFAERFAAKGRLEQKVAALPVKTVIHPQPGLIGAAAAFARQS